jgi:hypothetical protein
VEEIYTTFTFAMIERLPSLQIPSVVEDKKYRKIHKLPLWVPDIYGTRGLDEGLPIQAP